MRQTVSHVKFELFLGRSDGTLRLWDLESGEGRPLQGHSGSVGGALLLPDGRRALSWSNDASDGTVRLWDLESGEGRLQGSAYQVDGALLLQDGRRTLSWWSTTAS
jgi:WD40 repeat protein